MNGGQRTSRPKLGPVPRKMVKFHPRLSLVLLVRFSCLRARLHDGRKILQGETTLVAFTCRSMQKFRSVRLTVEKELKIKDYSLNDPTPYLCGLSQVLVSS